jgi:glycerophosphoryl diester phosphodiesterase
MKPWIIAHRGASGSAPENTLAAVRLAWEQGADAVEVDVYVARDRDVVVIHDDTLDRVAGVGGHVAERTVAELKCLDVGRWKHSRWAGERIPTLGEVLALVPPGKRQLVELKAGRELLESLSRTIPGCGVGPDQLAFISFSLPLIGACKETFPASAALWLLEARDLPLETGGPRFAGLLTALKEARLDGVDVEACAGVNAEWVDALHDAGHRVFVWTVNDPAEVQRLTEAGVDGITTDWPGDFSG